MSTGVFNNDAIFDFVNYLSENVNFDHRTSKRFAQSFHQMSANPDLFESATLMSYNNNKSDYYTIDKNIIWSNPNDHAVNLAYTLCHNSRNMIGQDVDWSSIPNYFWIGSNHHPSAVKDICRRYENNNRYSKSKTKMLWWGELCLNQHPVVVEIVDEIIEKTKSSHFIYDISKHNLGPNNVHLGRLAANPSATDVFLQHGWLERSLDSHHREQLWKAFSTNPDPKAIRYMKENLDKVDFSWLSHNPNSRAIEMLKERPDQIDWKWLSTNPAAIKMIKANPRKIHIGMMSKNPHPEAIELLYGYFDNDPTSIDFRGLLLKNHWDQYRHAHTIIA